MMSLLTWLCQHHLPEERKSHHDDRPSLRTIACRNAPAMLFYDALDDGQTETCTAGASREEWLKNPWQVFWVESRTSILDRIGHQVSSIQGYYLGLYYNTPPRWRMLDGVVEEILEHLHQALPIHAD
jgi:hypothetical protein